jgi:pullulanase/glycogen debranching enzyme
MLKESPTLTVEKANTSIDNFNDFEINLEIDITAEPTREWYKEAVFYEVYVRAFSDSNSDGHGDLLGLTSRLDYLSSLGINCIWLLPIYPSPLKDDDKYYYVFF